MKPITNVCSPWSATARFAPRCWASRIGQPDASELEQMKDLTRVGDGGGRLGTVERPDLSARASTPRPTSWSRSRARCGGSTACTPATFAARRRTVLNAIDEAMEIGRQAEVPVQVSHVKVCGHRNFGMIDRTDGNGGERRGVGTCRCISTSTRTPPAATSLISVLPEWTYVGGSEASTRRLADPAARRRLRREMEAIAGLFLGLRGYRRLVGSMITSAGASRVSGPNGRRCSARAGRRIHWTHCSICWWKSGAWRVV